MLVTDQKLSDAYDILTLLEERYSRVNAILCIVKGGIKLPQKEQFWFKAVLASIIVE